MEKRNKAYLALLTTSLIWGFAPPIIKYSLNFVTPIEFLFFRFLIVCLCIFPIFIIKLKKNHFKLKDLGLLILISLCGTSFTLGLLFWGLSLTTAVDSALIASMCPLMIVLAGVIFLRETITRQEKIGLFLAFLGTLIAVVSPLVTGHVFTGSFWGNFLTIIAFFRIY